MTLCAAIVLGAAGFIGRHVSRELASQGLTVHGLGHGAWEERDWRLWGLSSWTNADVDASIFGLLTSVAPIAVIHCAGSSSISHSYASPLADFERSVVAVATVAEAVRRCKGNKIRIVIASSAAVYGDQGDVDLTETAARSPVSPYGFHKVLAENICDSYSRFFGIRVSIIRLFSVYGNGLRKQLLWDALEKLRQGNSQFFGTGHELRDWIHVHDAARLLCAAALTPQSNFEIYNGGHEKASTRQILTSIADLYRPGLSPLFSGETHTGNPRRLTSDCSHAMRQLKWTPNVPLVDGISQYIDWYKANRDIDSLR